MRPRRVTSVLAALILFTSSFVAAADRWTRVGPDTATVRSLAAAPSRPTTVYAGLSTGGVYRSTDAGKTWTPASWGLQTIYPVYQLAVAPASPETVYAITAAGLFRSTTGGGSWQELDPDRETPGGAREIAVHPRDGRTVYAVLFQGELRRSTDGGDSWVDLPDAPDIYHLRIDPVRPNILYATTLNDPGLWKSMDEGRSWTRTGGTELHIWRFETDPRSSETLYASFITSDPRQQFNRSTDGGETWAPLPHPQSDRSFLLLGTALRGAQLTLFGTLGERLYRSLNGGLSWSEAGAGLPASPVGPGPVAATSGAVLLSTYEGIFRSTNGGRSWVSSSRNLKEGLIEGLARGSALYAGAPNQGIYASVDRQGGWRRLSMGAELARDFYGPLAADPRQPGKIYASTSEGIARSEDGGASWEVSDTGCLRADEIVIDPSRPESLYITGIRPAGSGPCARASSVCEVQKSEDGGRTWTCIRNGLPDQELSLLTVDPHHPSTLLVRAEYDLYRSTDGGASWSLLAPFSSATGPVPRSLVFDPREPDRVYAGFQTTIARSTDGGRTWSHFRQGLASRDAVVLDLEIDPVDTRTLYAMTSGSGVFKSTDAGETWAPLGTGLEGLRPEALLLDPRDRSTLYVRTRSDGLLKLTQSAP